MGTAWIDSVDNGAAGSSEALYDKLEFEIEGYDEGESPFSVNAMGQIAVVAEKLDYEEKRAGSVLPQGRGQLRSA